MHIRHATVALAFAAAIVAAVQTQAAPSNDSHARGAMASSCEAERLSAWFERQREITDGDVDPRQPIATPAACMPHADAGMDDGRQAVSDAAHARAVPVATSGARG